LFRLCAVNSVLDEGRVREVVARIAASGRQDALPLLGHFARLVRLDCDRRAALVASALPLPADVREDLSAQIARAHGLRIRVTFAVEPALLGGVSIRVGSHVYDGSVRARLAALESRL
jgi:F-type H+-transporting ATPase subunit delta